MFGDYTNLHHYGSGKNNNEKFYISDEEFLTCVQDVKNNFSNKNISSLSNEESNDTYFFVAPNMQIVGLSADNYFSLGNVLNMNMDDLKSVKEAMHDTLKNAKKNRSWTIHNEEVENE